MWTGNVAFALDYMPHMGTDEGLHYLLGCNGNGVAMMTYLGTQTAQEDRRRPQRADQPARRPRVSRARRSTTAIPWFLPTIGAWYRTRDWIDRRLAAW